MKKLLILLFSILISVNSYGEFTEIGTNKQGRTYYVDYDSITEDGRYINFWMLTDYVTSSKGFMSDQVYMKINCKVLSYKPLKGTSYKGQMGKGEKKKRPISSSKWTYMVPNTIGYFMFTEICKYVKNENTLKI